VSLPIIRHKQHNIKEKKTGCPKLLVKTGEKGVDWERDVDLRIKEPGQKEEGKRPFFKKKQCVRPGKNRPSVSQEGAVTKRKTVSRPGEKSGPKKKGRGTPAGRTNLYTSVDKKCGKLR